MRDCVNLAFGSLFSTVLNYKVHFCLLLFITEVFFLLWKDSYQTFQDWKPKSRGWKYSYQAKIETLQQWLERSENSFSSFTRGIICENDLGKYSLFLLICWKTIYRKLNLLQLSRPKLISCSKSEMSFKRWFWVIRFTLYLHFFITPSLSSVLYHNF